MRRFVQFSKPEQVQQTAPETAANLLDHLVGKGEKVDGTVRPSGFAVVRLIRSSNLFGCSTGSSAGLATLKFADISACLPIAVVPDRAVAHQAARTVASRHG